MRRWDKSEKPNLDEVEEALLAYIKLHNQGEANTDEMIKEHIQVVVDEDEVVKDKNKKEEQKNGEEPQSQHDQQEQKSQQEGQVKRCPGRPKADKVRDVGGMELVPCDPEQQPLRRLREIKS